MLHKYMQGPEGDEIIKLALQNPENYVLKEQTEGEGNLILYQRSISL